MVIKDGCVLLGKELAAADVAFDEKITEVGEKLTGGECFDASGCYVVPGFVEIHSHGAVGEDFSDGKAAGLQPMADYYAAHGVTSFLATTMTLPEDVLTVLAVLGRHGSPCRWIRIADEIRSTEPVAAIRYVRDEEDFGKWDPKVYRILVLKVASDVSKTVGGNAEEHSTLERMYRTALEEAKVRDTRQSNPGPAAVWGGNYYVDRMTGRRV